VYCKGTIASCTSISQVQSFVEDVAFVMYSTDKGFRERVRFYAGPVGLNPSNYSMNLANVLAATTPLTDASFDNAASNAIVMKIAAPASKDPVDETVLDFTYQEVWDRVGCPKLRSITEGHVANVRAASYVTVDLSYDFVPLPLNFLETLGAEYCFESYEGITTDFGLAQTYERDFWRGNSESNAETNAATGYGTTDGGVSVARFELNSRNSNYCNRGNNRMPTVSTCNGTRIQTNWLNSNRAFPKWYKDDHRPVYAKANNNGSETDLLTKPSGVDTDLASSSEVATPYSAERGYGHRKWFLCGGNGTWDNLRPGTTSVAELEDYEIRLRPGYRGTDQDSYYRINNRSFKAYARVPGSRAIHKQAFTMTVRAATYVWEYDWPHNYNY
jgi:hypothetical protein